VETLRNLADLAAEVARLPDDAQVGWGTAALLINVEEPPSQRTLERWRQARNKLGENGPPYIPGPGLTSPVSYNVGAVRAWVRERQATTTMDASVRRGLTFGSLSDLVRPEPWVHRNGKVLAHALDAHHGDLLDALMGRDGVEIVVAGLSDVMREILWVDTKEFDVFHAVFRAVLGSAEQQSNDVRLASELDGENGLRHPVPAEGLCPRGCGKPAHNGRCRL